MKRVTVLLLAMALASLAWIHPSDGLPDLVITSIFFEPDQVTVPADVWVEVVIENQGQASPRYGVDVGVNVHGPHGWMYGVAAYVGSMPRPGGSIKGRARIDNVPYPGKYSVVLEVDPFYSVPESNEDNNYAEAVFVAH